MDSSKLDVDALFRQYYVRDIKQVEKQIKNEIEKKKEELRSMVYNRYRDIIEAADAIHVMKTCSKQIEDVLNNLQSSCESFKIVNIDKLNTVEKLTNVDLNKRNSKYVLAVIIKVLQNSPSKIWYHLDNNEYHKAAIQYLFAQHVHVCLDLEKGLKEEKNSYYYLNYGNELWNSVVFLKNTIINRSKATFQQANTTSLVVMDAIVAILLLENLSLQTIFNEYLSTRIPSICGLLTLDNIDENVTVKTRIINALSAFTNTITNIYEVFYADCVSKNESLNANLLPITTCSFESKLNANNSTTELLKNDGFVVHKIPNYLTSFKYTQVQVKPLELSYLNDQSKNWLNKCIEELKKAISNSFKYATNLKNLSLIREAIIEFINKNCLQTNNEWNIKCKSLFDRHLDIWNELLATFYYEQSKFIVENYFQIAHDNLFKNLSDNLNSIDLKSFETDINSYLWSDVDSAHTSSTVATADKIPENYTNIYKTKGVTPVLQKLCKCLDDDMNKLIVDIENSTKFDDHYQQHNEDISRFNTYLQNYSSLFSEKLVNSFKKLIDELTNKMNNSDNSLTKLLLIARLVHTLPNCCPQLKVSYYYSNRHDSKKRIMLFTASEQKSAADVDDNWIKLCHKLSEICNKIYNTWTQNACLQLKENYLSVEKLENSEIDLDIDGLLVWDDHEIEDEIESGKQLKTKISVPVVCSPLIQHILYDTCQQIIKVLPYTMIQSIAKQISHSIFRLICQNYKNKIDLSKNNKSFVITQNNALQMLFDLKYLNILFDLKDDGTNSDLISQFKTVCNQLEEFIDPFDFDILTPFIQSNINKTIARTSTLYGTLNGNDRYIRNTNTQTITNDVHNLLLLSNNTQRFELLPISNTIISTSTTPSLSASSSNPNMNLANTSNVTLTKSEKSKASSQNLTKDTGISALYKKWFQ